MCLLRGLLVAGYFGYLEKYFRRPVQMMYLFLLSCVYKYPIGRLLTRRAVSQRPLEKYFFRLVVQGSIYYCWDDESTPTRN